EVWAAEQMPDMGAWLGKRQQAAPLKLVRFDSDSVNIKQPYFNHEIHYANQYESMQLTWFFISILDLYDRVWHCRSCLATSDVWLAPESRPPASCPACGYVGERET